LPSRALVAGPRRRKVRFWGKAQLPNVRTKIPVVEVIAPDGHRSPLGCRGGEGQRRGGCKRGNSSQLCCHTHKATANDYPEVGSTPARRSAEGQAMTHPKRHTHNAKPPRAQLPSAEAVSLLPRRENLRSAN